MDFSQLDQQTKEDKQLSVMIQEMAGEMESQGAIEKSGRYIAGVDDVFIGLAAYALFRWAKDYFDYQRAKNETEIAERRARIVAGLTADGFEPEKARAVTEGLFRQIAQRTEDDPVLQKAVALIRSGGS